MATCVLGGVARLVAPIPLTSLDMRFQSDVFRLQPGMQLRIRTAPIEGSPCNANSMFAKFAARTWRAVGVSSTCGGTIAFSKEGGIFQVPLSLGRGLGIKADLVESDEPMLRELEAAADHIFESPAASVAPASGGVCARSARAWQTWFRVCLLERFSAGTACQAYWLACGYLPT